MTPSSISRALRVFAGLLTLVASGWAIAEPPLRAARLGHISGAVSFSPGGQADWVQAVVNRPLTTGDRLWADSNSRAELQLGGAAIRLGALTNVTLLNLDDRIVQLQLLQGSLSMRVRHLGPRQSFEIDTPNLAFTVRQAGEYRIDVDLNGDATAVRIQSGLGEVYGDGAAYTVDSQRGYRFYGTDLSDYETLAARPDDEFDRWARNRDRRVDDSPSARYVSPDVVGYQDLDSNGIWRNDTRYGPVWTPSRVPAGWTPYRDGHWAWVDPWGWTWVDDAPWGYAVSHYGRWANSAGSWVWVPGPVREQAVYAPALVAFVGGNNFRLAISAGSGAAVGWFPLAPSEVYRPSYPVSRVYFDNVNRSNAVIAPAVITNVYNTTVVNNTTTVINNTTNVTKVVYVNQQVAGAVVAVPAQAFVQSQSVARAAVLVPVAAAVSAPVMPVAAVVPVQQSVHGGAAEAGAKPPKGEQVVVARTAPPPPPVAFAAQQQQLAAKPGAPIDAEQRKQLLPVAPAIAAPKVNVVTAAQAPVPTALPPAAPPAGKTPEARKAEAAAVAPSKVDPARAEAPKLEAARADAAKADAAKAEAAKADAARADAARAAGAKAEAIRADAAKAEAAKVEAGRADTAKAESMRLGNAKAEAAKAEAARAEAAKVEAAKVEAAKADAARGDALKAEATRAANARADAVKADAAKADAVRAETARAEASKAEAARAANARAEADRAVNARADTERAANARAEADRAANARAEAGRAANARADAAKAESARADAQRAATAKADAARSEALKNEAAAAAAAAGRAANANAEAARAEAARAARAAAVPAPAPAPVTQAPPVRPPGAESPPAKPHPPGPKSDTEDEKKKKGEEDARKR